MPWSAISIAAGGGALLGAALVYGLANWLPLPDTRTPIADPAVRLDQQDASLSDIETRLAAIEDQSRRTQVSLDATITQLDTGLNEVRQSIAAVPAAVPVDLAPIEQQLAGLEDRVTAIGAGASSADATALAEAISRIETELASLRSDATGSTGRAGDVDAALEALRTELAALRAGVSAQAVSGTGGDIGPAVRLPLVVSGLESALINGRPYATELQGISAMLPDLAVPEPVAAGAAAGLPRPDTVAQQLEARVPDILAGRAAESSGDMGADALEWMKGLLALRPVGEAVGDSPEATVSQLEAAVERRDFSAASGLLAALPPAMQAGAGEAGAGIIALAAADAFLADLRARALGTSPEASP